MIKINENIALLRKKKGITQEELANILNVSNQAVSKWESGKCCPDMELLPDLAHYFEVSIDELLGYERPVKAPTFFQTDKELILQAIKIAKETNKISSSILQRKLKIGYTKAKTIIDEMVKDGVIIKDTTKTYDSYLYVTLQE